MPHRTLAILGGGLGGLSTALALTDPGDADPSATPWRTEFDRITVYQMGWRLGGKCASGRGLHGRIEEHGIHLFGGGYYNALGLMERVYDHLQRTPGGWHTPFDEAFERQYLSLVFGGPSGQRSIQALDFPHNTRALADAAHFDSTAAQLGGLLQTLGALLLDKLLPGEHLEHSFNLLQISGLGGLGSPLQEIRHHLDDLVSRLRAVHLDLDALDKGVALVVGLLQRFVKPLSVLSQPLKDGLLAGELLLTVVRGTVVDVLIKRKTYDDLDRLDWAAWLASHGASDAAIDSPLGVAPLGILYQPRQPGVRQRLGAGGYLQWQLRTLAYQQAPFWFFGHGTGETVVLPIYELLKRRGVQFEFFHQVDALQLNASRDAVARVQLTRQAVPRDPAAGYDPLVAVGTLPYRCWPSQPDWGQLQDAATLQAHDLESYFNRVPATPANALTLTDGVDFTDLVLAIPPGALPYIGAELLAQLPAWRAMHQALPTVATQSLQVWLDAPSSALGAQFTPADPDDTALGCGYEHPFDGIVDFSPLLRQEAWPTEGAPQALWYFSDVMDTDPPLPAPGAPAAGYRDQAHQQVRDTSLAFMNHRMDALLPKAVVTGPPERFRFEHLVAPASSVGVARFDAQYWRANVEPSERYTSSPPGSSALRLKADGSGLRNLVLAGDWIYTGLNVGCVEATVMSGRLAANALRGLPLHQGVIGYPKP